MGPHLSQWVRIEELVGTTVEDLADRMAALHPLFVTAANDAAQRLYAWVSM